MNTHNIITIILALLVGSSIFSTLMLPVGTGDTPQEIEESMVFFGRRRQIFALITTLMIGALASSFYNQDAWMTGGFAGTAALTLVLYATVLQSYVH
jgi:hypothetical protein